MKDLKRGKSEESAEAKKKEEISPEKRGEQEVASWSGDAWSESWMDE